jgi:hypothetical protein
VEVSRLGCRVFGVFGSKGNEQQGEGQHRGS